MSHRVVKTKNQTANKNVKHDGVLAVIVVVVDIVRFVCNRCSLHKYIVHLSRSLALSPRCHSPSCAPLASPPFPFCFNDGRPRRYSSFRPVNNAVAGRSRSHPLRPCCFFFAPLLSILHWKIGFFSFGSRRKRNTSLPSRRRRESHALTYSLSPRSPTGDACMTTCIVYQFGPLLEQEAKPVSKRNENHSHFEERFSYLFVLFLLISAFAAIFCFLL